MPKGISEQNSVFGDDRKMNENEIESKYCRNCKKLVETPVINVLPRARLSLLIMLIVVWLNIGLRMTEAAIPELPS